VRREPAPDARHSSRSSQLLSYGGLLPTAANEDRSASGIQIGLRKIEGFADPQS
jgi:hypothetical protein